MTNTTNTTKAAKVRKTNRKIVATVCAVIAATAMITGIAVFSASAKTIKSNTESSTVTASVQNTTTQAQNKAEETTKAAVQQEAPVVEQQEAPVVQQQEAPVVQQQTAPVVQKQEAPVVQQQEAPVVQQQEAPVVQKQTAPVVQQQEAPVVQKQEAPVVQQQEAPAVQQQTAPVVQKQTAPVVQKQEAPAVQKQEDQYDKILTIPEGEVNDWKTHDAKTGFPIGQYLDRSQKKFLNVTKLDRCNYSITVKIITGENTADIYNISAVANGSKMYYTNAAKSEVVYAEDAVSVVESKIVSSGHSGTFDASDAGYTWVDSIDGTMVFVPWVGYR